MSARPLALAAAMLACATAGSACGLASGDGGSGEESTSSTSTSATTSASGNGSGGVTGTLDPTPCESSEECGSGYCVSGYDAGANPPIGPSVCVSECVEAGALDRACTDDASCCGELVCDAQALCIEPDAGTDTGTTDTGDTDTGDTGTTGN